MLATYAPVVRRIATSLRRMRPAHLDHNDSVQDGMIALLLAIRTQRDKGEGQQFLAYLITRVRGAIIDAYRDGSGISRSEYAAARKTRQAQAQGLAVTPEQAAQAREVMAAAWLPAQSLCGDDPIEIAAPLPGPEQRLMCNQMLRRAIAALQQVSERDREIFIACELQGEGQASLAGDFGISVGRVSQIVKQVRREVISAAA